MPALPTLKPPPEGTEEMEPLVLTPEQRDLLADVIQALSVFQLTGEPGFLLLGTQAFASFNVSLHDQHVQIVSLH